LFLFFGQLEGQLDLVAMVRTSARVFGTALTNTNNSASDRIRPREDADL